jgi:hypothetical protein
MFTMKSIVILSSLLHVILSASNKVTRIFLRRFRKAGSTTVDDYLGGVLTIVAEANSTASGKKDHVKQIDSGIIFDHMEYQAMVSFAA